MDMPTVTILRWAAAGLVLFSTVIMLANAGAQLFDAGALYVSTASHHPVVAGREYIPFWETVWFISYFLSALWLSVEALWRKP